MTSKLSAERSDLIAKLGAARHFLRFPLRDLTDEQARARPTVSALCLGGLIKHVAHVERGWADFAVRGAIAMPLDEAAMVRHQHSFQLTENESLESVLADYGAVAAHTDELVATVPDLDHSHPLPEAPWFTPGARCSVRGSFLQIIAETAQHAGHADILRETIDGATSMA